MKQNKVKDEKNKLIHIKKKNKIPSLIPNAKVYQFIDSFKKGDVLAMIAKENNVGVKNVFDDFKVVTYQAARYKDTFFFVQENMLSEAKKAFSLWSNNPSKFYGYLVIVRGDKKFLELIQKTSPGFGGKTKSNPWCREVIKDYSNSLEKDKLAYLKQIFIDNHKMLQINRIILAMISPKQTRDWTCGINSAFKDLCLLDLKYNGTYDKFIDYFPKYICKKTTKDNAVNATLGGCLLTGLGILGAPLTGGTSLIASAIGSAITVGGVGTGIVNDNFIPKNVGPSPLQLTETLNSLLSETKYKTEFLSFKYFSSCKNTIENNISNNLPVIGLIINSPSKMHYVNFVGTGIVDEENNDDEKYNDETFVFDILDTDNEIYTVPEDKVKEHMDADGVGVFAALFGQLKEPLHGYNRYNIIRFYTK